MSRSYLGSSSFVEGPETKRKPTILGVPQKGSRPWGFGLQGLKQSEFCSEVLPLCQPCLKLPSSWSLHDPSNMGPIFGKDPNFTGSWRLHPYILGNDPNLTRSPSSALLRFFWEGSPTTIDCRKKGTLILTSLLEDLV